LRRIFTIIIPLLVLAAALAPPASAGMLDVSEAKEIKLGKEAADTLIHHYGLVTNPAEMDRVTGITDYLIKAGGRPDLEYHFYIIDTDFINAFALPGGYIFLTRGLMDFVDDDDELAAVISHELVHVAHKHGVVMYKKSLKNMVMNFIILAITKDPKAVVASQMYQKSRMDIFGRSAEVEADTFGIRYMKKAGYNCCAMMRFLEKLERENSHRPNLIEDYFEFHPPMDERKKIVTSELENQGIEIAGTYTKNRISERVIVHENCGENGCTASIMGGTDELMVIGDSGSFGTQYERGLAIASSLNSLLSDGVRMYELKKKNNGDEWSLVARNVMIVKVLPGDLEVNGRGEPGALLDLWISGIKHFLWSDFVKEDI